MTPPSEIVGTASELVGRVPVLGRVLGTEPVQDHTHDAWILGRHLLDPELVPSWIIEMQHPPGMVLVHDLENDSWEVISMEEFNKEFEWVPSR